MGATARSSPSEIPMMALQLLPHPAYLRLGSTLPLVHGYAFCLSVVGEWRAVKSHKLWDLSPRAPG